MASCVCNRSAHPLQDLSFACSPSGTPEIKLVGLGVRSNSLRLFRFTASSAATVVNGKYK